MAPTPSGNTGTTLRVGVCGFGASASYFHMPLIRNEPSLALAAVFDPTPERRRLAQEEGFEAALLPEDLGHAVKKLSLDLIIITSPNSFHFDQAYTALDAGAHVLVDKPVGLRSEDVGALIRLSASKNLVLMAFQNRQYDDDHLQALYLVNSQAIGRITRIDMAIAGWGPFSSYAAPQFNPRWRVERLYGGGCLLDWGPHVLDQMLRFSGWQLPRRVYASARSSIWSVECDDLFTAIYDWKEVSARVLVSTLDLAPVERLRVCGTKGTIVTRGDDNVGEVILYSPNGAESRPYATSRLSAAALYRDLITAIQTGMREVVRARLEETRKLYELIDETTRRLEPLA